MTEATKKQVIDCLRCIAESTEQECKEICNGAYKCFPQLARDVLELLKAQPKEGGTG